MMPDAGQLLTEGLKLNLEQRGLIIRVGWILIVTGHIMWICGFLGVLGLQTPFVKAEDVAGKLAPIAAAQKVQGDKLDKVSKLLTEQLAQTVAGQIRLNISKRCKTNDPAIREELAKEKDNLQEQYLAYKGNYYHEPQCSEL